MRSSYCLNLFLCSFLAGLRVIFEDFSRGLSDNFHFHQKDLITWHIVDKISAKWHKGGWYHTRLHQNTLLPRLPGWTLLELPHIAIVCHAVRLSTDCGMASLVSSLSLSCPYYTVACTALPSSVLSRYFTSHLSLP